MRQFPHVKRNHRSGNRTYFRRFPKEVHAVNGRTFFERSLRTSDRRALHTAWNEAHAEFLSIVERLRSSIADSPLRHADGCREEKWLHQTEWPHLSGEAREASIKLLQLDLGSIRQAITMWGQRDRYDRAQRLLNDPAYMGADDAFSAECAIVGAAGRARNWLFFNAPLHDLTRQVLRENNIQVPEWHGSLYAIERMVEGELRNTLEAEARWRRYELGDLPAAPNFNTSNSLAPNNQPFVSLTALVERYIETTRKPKKTASKLRLVTIYINDIAGKDIRLDELTKDILIRLQADALRIPARISRSERQLGFVKLVAMQDRTDDTRPRLTPQAVRSWFNLLGGCLNWAVAADLLERNPTAGIKPKASTLTDVRRTSFTLDELQTIFSIRKCSVISNDAK